MVTNSISVPLKSLGEFRNGVNFSKEKKGIGLGLINVKDIFSDIPIINYETLDKVDLAGKKGIENYFVEAGDLFFVRSSVKRDGVGLVSLAKTGSRQAIHCGFVIRFRITDENVHPKFLTYLLRSPHYREVIIGASGGAAITNISQSVLGSIEISLPPLNTQRRIAAVLSAYDDLIENNTRRIQILEELAQAIYRQWFVEFQYPGHEAVPLVDSGTDLGKIPQGWEVKKLGDFAESVRRNVKPGEIKKGTPYFGLGDLPKKSIALNQWDVVDDIGSAKLAFHKGEILFGKIRPYFHKVGVAPLDGIGSSDIIVIQPKSSDFFGLVLAVVSSEKFVEHATLTSQGTKMPRANWDVLTEYPIAYPNSEFLERFNAFMQDAVELIHNYIFKNANLRATRDLLLPRLVSGAVDVSGVEIS